MNNQIKIWLPRTVIAAAMTAGLFSGPALVAADAAKDKEAESYKNWVDFGVGGVMGSGNDASLQSRQYQRKGVYGGIEDMHFEAQPDKKTTVSVDGRALADLRDYKVRLEAVRQDLGYFRAGYKSYDTWYNDAGGILPSVNNFIGVNRNDALRLERGEVFVEAGLNLKDLPVLSLRYTYQWRDGLKDSTAWGQVVPTAPFSPFVGRGVAPSFYDIDEHRHIVEADLKHTIGIATLGAGLRYEASDLKNSRNMRGLDQGGFTAAPNDNVFVTQKDKTQTDLWHTHAFVLLPLNEQVFLSGSYAYSSLDNTIGGSRVMGADFDPVYNATFVGGNPFFPYGFLDLSGGSVAKEHAMNLNLMYKPSESFSITPSIAYKHVGIDSQSSYDLTGTGLAPFGPAINAYSAQSGRNYYDFDGRLEARYTGISNIVLYARGEWTYGSGDLREVARNIASISGGTIPSPVDLSDFSINDDRLYQKYVAGVNWYACHAVSFDVQGYHKVRSTSYSYNNQAPTGAYPGFFKNENTITDDANIRITLRPLGNVTVVSRYDLQYSTIQGTPYTGAFADSEYETGKITTHVFSESITWVPFSRLYLQAVGSYVDSLTDTTANNFSSAVLDARNNYWTITGTAGLVLDNKTDLTASYLYYRANNFQSYADALGNSFVPYGADAREHGVNVGLTRQIKSNILWNVRYGFYAYRDAMTGGWNNYDAHVVSSTLTYRF